jgi:hypothetical protein
MLVRSRSLFVTLLLLAGLAIARPAMAGPPLLCHPFDIGPAASLPWGSGSGWFDGSPSYRLGGLVADTEALLTPETPVVVRMETLRRASIYASHDPKVAAELLDRLTARAIGSKTAGRPDALAFMDAAYATEALRQIVLIGGVTGYKDRVDGLRDVLRGHDGVQYINTSLAAKPGDAGLEFAAALIAAGKDRAAYERHAERARAGASEDALLARNLKHLS